jgi:O-acetylhomoserine (thiol)-lyase
MQQLDEISTQILQTIGSKTEAVSPAITNSASFAYGSSENAEAIFSGTLPKPMYSRMGNPTNAKLEEVLAKLEGGAGAIATSSGMGAISMALVSHLQSGDEVISIGGLFGGTYALLSETLDRFGVTTHFFDVDELESIENTINQQTKILYVESVGNPSMSLPDLPRLIDLANRYDLLCIVDNTTTPLTVQPLKLGADIVVYSTTKIISGNSSALGGIAVFNGARAKLLERFPFYKKFIDKLGEKAMVGVAKKRALRDFGMSASAFSSYLTMLGLETLPLRIEKIASNTERIVAALADKGFQVNHPSLKSNPYHKRYHENFNGVIGSLFTIDFGSKEKAFAFLNQSKLITITANISDTRTLGLHMASTIYKDFSEKEKKFLGITEGLVRISVGLENPEEIIEDFCESAIPYP